ncbi:uncharacterized protein LAESUDRAFT_59474 [Laetiporus sulphureus 93-53]|uniref:Peptidase M20 dimerisation domain-containing protein n=1 Tax=Laetiporus sulphureus 93-53 TaxID=1314785 RepID=A0A165AYL1_9APHY|nr:uncharacterized protein LAESUDRAFT_59474 [Laetiporus sulphureus 93-53]KZS99903.1 hypothetical protein LAESUDRAFT_59474 [Laetiporus sulphureus 93-53]
MLLNEGGVVLEQCGGIFAFPAIAEKGYFDMRIEVNAPGGHSSVPPAHTSLLCWRRCLFDMRTTPRDHCPSSSGKLKSNLGHFYSLAVTKKDNKPEKVSGPSCYEPFSGLEDYLLCTYSLVQATTGKNKSKRRFLSHKSIRVFLMFRRVSPMYIHAQCLAAHGSAFPASMREVLQRLMTSGKVLCRAEGMLFKIPSFKALVSMP